MMPFDAFLSGRNRLASAWDGGASWIVGRVSQVLRANRGVDSMVGFKKRDRVAGSFANLLRELAGVLKWDEMAL
jgi:hypothetical protein